MAGMKAVGTARRRHAVNRDVFEPLEDGFRVRVRTGGHEYVLDEPVDQGGTGQGATPGEVLLAALAGCQTMVAHLYFRTQRITARSVVVGIEADGPVDMQTGEIQVEFNVTLTVDADVSDEQLTDLRAFVDRMCLVGTTIRQPNVVNLRVARA